MQAGAPGEVTVVGVDIGGTNTRVGLVDSQGRITRRLSVPTVRGPLADVKRLVAAVIAELLDNSGSAHPVGIGVGMRGVIDLDAQRYASGVLFSGWEYDLRGELEQALGLPVRLANDVNAAACAELRWGVGRQRSCFTYINIGTGMGAAVVDHGHLLRGSRDMAGEIAYYLLPADRRREHAQQLEAVVSGAGFEQELRRLVGQHPASSLAALAETGVQASQVFEGYRGRDPLAVTVVEAAVAAVAQLVVNVEAITDSGCYVFGGGVLSGAEWFIERVGEQIRALRAEAGLAWEATLQISSLGVDGAGLLGAAAIALTESDRRHTTL